MRRKLIVPLVAFAALLPAAMAGCGGGGSGSGQTKGNLGVTNNLKAAQDDADIQEFCNLAQVPKGELYDRALISVIAATDDLIIVYKRHPDGTYWDALKKREKKLKQLVQENAKKLNTCGKDGKRQSAKLTSALQGR